MARQIVKGWDGGRRERALAGVAILLLAILAGVLGQVGPVAAAAWVPGGTLPAAYAAPLTTLLPDGRVLAVYGKNSALRSREGDGWTALAPFDTETSGAALIVLADGKALLAGGAPNPLVNNPLAPTTRVLRFNPATAQWTPEADMPTGRAAHTLTPLADGRVLAAGGAAAGLSPRQPVTTVGRADRYDPTTKTWASAAPMIQARFAHTATLLPDGRVLVVGGVFAKTVNSTNAGTEPLASVEIYNPTANTWQEVAPLSKERRGHTATLLHDGTVLVVGGERGTGATTAERYDPKTNTWTPAGSPGITVRRFATTLLLDGDVVVTGGAGVNEVPTTMASRYLAATNSWQAFPALTTPRADHGAILVAGRLLLIGGEGGAATSTESYDAIPEGTVCYPETGRCAVGTFQAYWQAHGRLPINGFPLSNPFPEQLEDGKVYLVQYFERVRMEAHPENTPPNTVLLGQFGRKIHPADPPAAQQPGATYFPQTGHNVSGRFLAYWQANGDLAQFGYPLTEVITETLGDGKSYEVQYFERARFEYHPENTDPQYQVLLGQFGRQILAGR